MKQAKTIEAVNITLFNRKLKQALEGGWSLYGEVFKVKDLGTEKICIIITK